MFRSLLRPLQKLWPDLHLLRRENEAMRRQLSTKQSLLLQLDQLGKENGSLRAQLSNVGLELESARRHVRRLEDGEHRGKGPVAARYRERQTLIILPRLVNLLPSEEKFFIVDAGAREVDRDPRWRPFPPGRLRFVGFEPDAAEAERLNALPAPDGIEWCFVPAGLWGSSGVQKFEHNNSGGGSSFLPQNRRLTDRWKFENPDTTALARDIFFSIREEHMQVVCLADWARNANVKEIDFLKLNVQGAEIEILRGAGDLLDTVLGILVEVSFVQSYQDRAMFADVDRFMHERGFAFFDLLAHHYVGRSAAPIAAQHLSVVEPKLGQLVTAWGQLIEGHALYLRDPIGGDLPQDLDSFRVLKLAAFAEAFGQIEYTFELLDWLSSRSDVTGTPMARKLRDVIAEAAAEYEALLSSGTPLPLVAGAADGPEQSGTLG